METSDTGSISSLFVRRFYTQRRHVLGYLKRMQKLTASMPADKQTNHLEQSQDRTGDYDQLKSWYLARLRKQALALQEKSLTPAGLIRADRDLIESLVLGAAAPGAAGRPPLPSGLPGWCLPAAYAAVMFLSFLLLLNTDSGSFSEAARHFLQLVCGTLIGQGADHAIFEKTGCLAFVVPAATFGIPCLISLLSEPAGNLIQAATGKGTGLLKNWLPGCSFTFLTAIFMVMPVTAICAADPTSPASDFLWHIIMSLSAWGCILITVLSSHLNQCFLHPLKNLLQMLEKGTGKQTDARTYADALPELVQELLKTRDELASRETLIADASPDLLLVLSPQEKIVCCNWTSQNLLGFLPEELGSKTLAELVLPEDIPAAREILSKVQTSKQSDSLDCRLQTRERRAVDMRCTIEFSATHNCFFVAAHDISDQKTLERAKREFVSMLGHDIRVPLSSALLTVQAMEQSIYGELPEKAEGMLSEVELSLKRLVQLLEELLEFEQLSAGKMRLELSSLNTGVLVSRALTELSGQAQKKKMTIEVLGEGLQIDGDAGKLLRVIVNLISNAIKFSPEGSKITVLTQSLRAGSVEIRISDEGPGIAPEYQKLVFERYERLESTACQQGSGLGLAIARSIVESHGGMIGVESQSGKGSTFWFTLPVQSTAISRQA
jgi:PAS domain S-box-containing protein